MSTTIATQPSIHRPRHRALLSVAIAAALTLGAGAVAVSVSSSDGTSGRQTSPAVTTATPLDVPALWNQLATLPVSERENIIAGLTPRVRAQLRATAESIAIAAEHH